MSLSVGLFVLVAGSAMVGALGVVLSQSVVRAAVWLLVSLVSVAISYFLLGAEFLGAAQLMVYVGGTLVLLVFGAMLTGPFQDFPVRRGVGVLGGLLALCLFGLLVSLSLRFTEPPQQTAPNAQDVRELGQGFLGVPDSTGRGYLLPFELLSVHLLVVLIAAAYLARAKRKTLESIDSPPGAGS
jgi:NADH-quinone oxidoreductase subunit J